MTVSVVIPVYNAEKTIARALDSVLSQTVKPLEIILVDDGSTDNSRSIIDKYIISNPDFEFNVIIKSNGGVSSARNSGLSIVKGELIALLDSDDEWFKNKLELQLEVLNVNADYSFVGGLIHPPLPNRDGQLDEITLSMLIFKNYFQPSTVIFKREIIDSVGLFDESQKYAEEGNYFMRVARNYKCALLNCQVVLYDRGKGAFGESGLSGNLKEMEKGELRNLKFALTSGFISRPKYFFAVVFSILKYVRRIIIVKLR